VRRLGTQILIYDFSEEDAEKMYPCELVGANQLRLARFPKRARPLRWPISGRNLPLESEQKFIPQVHISDFCVPMLSLGVFGRVDFTQVRWCPEKIFKLSVRLWSTSYNQQSHWNNLLVRKIKSGFPPLSTRWSL